MIKKQTLFSKSGQLLCAGLVVCAGFTMGRVVAEEEMSFKAGETPFLGVFTHLESRQDFDAKQRNLEELVAGNPLISGVTIKLWWKHLHPEKDVVHWAKLDKLIETAHRNGKRVNIALMPGMVSPDWVFKEGAVKAGKLRMTKWMTYTTIPWDPVFMELYLRDLKEMSKRYRDDPRVFSFVVLGHNYNEAGEEMHTPAPDAVTPYGWSREVALENWKYWIDQYVELFPHKKLSVCISQMYKDASLVEEVVEYFVEQSGGRGFLQTHQVSGLDLREASSGKLCLRFSETTPNAHETVGSYSEQPERQGSYELVCYKAIKMGNPLFFQLWRRDCNDPQYAEKLLQTWELYKDLTGEEMEADLKSKGLYVEAAPKKWVPFTKRPPVDFETCVFDENGVPLLDNKKAFD